MRGSAPGHGVVRVRVVQHSHGHTAPARHNGDQPLGQRRGVEHTAVEQHGVGLRALLGQKRGQMAGDGGLGRVRQAQTGEGVLATAGQLGDRRVRQETFDDALRNLFAAQGRRAGLRQQFGACPQQGDCH